MVDTAERNIKYLPFAILIALYLPNLVQHGMFLDGVTYASISRNLAFGIGSFWQPHYTQTVYPEFFEHPPLAFGLQAAFFKLLGDYFFVEKFYSLITALLTFAGIAACWQQTNEYKYGSLAWPALLCWFCMPPAIWSYGNNMLENTVAVFCLFAVFLSIKGCKQNRILPLLWAGFFIVLAFFTKGFVALFPLIVPCLYWLVFRSSHFTNFLKQQFALIFGTICIFAASVCFIPEASDFIKAYIHQQVVPSLSGEREVTVDNRLQFLWTILQALLIPLFLMGFMLVHKGMRKTMSENQNLRGSLFFILLACCASLPLLLSPKLRDFYLVPALPFFALSFGFMLYPLFLIVFKKLQSIANHSIQYLNVALVCIGLLVSILNFGGNSRDELLLQDVFTLKTVIPDHNLISTQEQLFSDWLFIAYLQRYGQISLEHSGHQPYLLLKKEEMPHPEIVHQYELSDTELNLHELYIRIK